MKNILPRMGCRLIGPQTTWSSKSKERKPHPMETALSQREGWGIISDAPPLAVYRASSKQNPQLPLPTEALPYSYVGICNRHYSKSNKNPSSGK